MSVELIHQRLALRGETLALAESCTGGLLSSQLAAQAGISEVFIGGVVVYSNRLKTQLLKVPANLLKSSGAVSLPVAVKMARGAQKELGSDWAVSITGVAGPSGGSVDKPVGTVCFAIVGPGFEVSERQQFRGDRVEIQKQSAAHALQLLLQSLNS